MYLRLREYNISMNFCEKYNQTSWLPARKIFAKSCLYKILRKMLWLIKQRYDMSADTHMTRKCYDVKFWSEKLSVVMALRKVLTVELIEILLTEEVKRIFI